MQLKGNFDPVANVLPGGIKVTGITRAFDDHELVARRVTLQQGTTVAEGPSNLVSGWETRPLLPAAGFDTDKPAVATGFELYTVKTTEAGATPAYVSVTWAESIGFG